MINNKQTFYRIHGINLPPFPEEKRKIIFETYSNWFATLLAIIQTNELNLQASIWIT